ncbi:RDD family protein [Clostridium sp.]
MGLDGLYGVEWAVILLYFTILMYNTNGRTLGMWLMRIRIRGHK